MEKGRDQQDVDIENKRTPDSVRFGMVAKALNDTRVYSFWKYEHTRDTNEKSSIVLGSVELGFARFGLDEAREVLAHQIVAFEAMQKIVSIIERAKKREVAAAKKTLERYKPKEIVKEVKEEKLKCPRCGGDEFDEIECYGGRNESFPYTCFRCKYCRLWYSDFYEQWLVDVKCCDDEECAKEYPAWKNNAKDDAKQGD